MGTFSDSVKSNVDRVVSEMDQKCYKIAYELFMAVVNYSPVQPIAVHSKGLFVNNWFATANSISSSIRSATDDYGIDSRNDILNLENNKTFLGVDGYLAFANSLSYAENVEYLGWLKPRWSGRVGPYAPVRTAMTEVQAKHN